MKEVKKVHKLIEYIDDTMKEYEDKVARGGELSSKDVECLKDLAKTKMAILTNEAMEDSDGGYSYADAKQDMIAELKELAAKAPDDKTKQEIDHFANELENK